MKRILLALALVASVATSGWATVVDLTASNSGTINGATFEFDQQQPSGTGVLNSFLRVDRNGTEQGYNTTVSNNPQLPFNEVFGNFTHDLLFSSLQPSNGEFLFVLDIGEPAAENPNQGQQSLLSLDGLKFFKTTIPGQNDDSVDGAGNANGIIGTLLYDMDGLEDSYVLLDANRDGHPGNGVSDMLLRVPESVFAGVLDTEYIILWSRFGLQQPSFTGAESFGTFEEWAHVTGLDDGGGPPQEVVPEPGTIMLLGTGLIGLALYGRRRAK